MPFQRTRILRTRLAAAIDASEYSRIGVMRGTGITFQVMKDYLEGSVPIHPIHLISLCMFLNCPPEDIIGFLDATETGASLSHSRPRSGS